MVVPPVLLSLFFYPIYVAGTNSGLGNVITSFPETWQHSEPFNLRQAVTGEILENRDRLPVKKAEDLAHLILRISLDFFTRKGPLGADFRECFRTSINDIVRRLISN